MATDRTRPRNLTTGEKADGTTSLNKRGRQPVLAYEPIRVSQEEIELAQRNVAANSLDAQDARELMGALGLLPGQGDWYGLDEKV